MKLVKYALISMAIVSAMANAADPIPHDNGEVSFLGTVTNGTCTVTANGGTAVDLKTVKASAFAKAASPIVIGDAKNVTPFTIDITGCDAAVTAAPSVTFLPNASLVDLTTGALRNSTDSSIGNPTGAANVEIALFDSTGKFVDASTMSNKTAAVAGTATGAYKANFQAGFVQPTASAVSGGQVNSLIAFEVDYQ